MECRKFGGRQHSSMLCRCSVLAILETFYHSTVLYQNDASYDHKTLTASFLEDFSFTKNSQGVIPNEGGKEDDLPVR